MRRYLPRGERPKPAGLDAPKPAPIDRAPQPAPLEDVSAIPAVNTPNELPIELNGTAELEPGTSEPMVETWTDAAGKRRPQPNPGEYPPGGRPPGEWQPGWQPGGGAWPPGGWPPGTPPTGPVRLATAYVPWQVYNGYVKPPNLPAPGTIFPELARTPPLYKRPPQ